MECPVTMPHPRGSMKHFTVLLTALLSACTVGEVPGGDGGGSQGGNELNTCEAIAANIAPAHDHALAGANPAGPRSRAGCMDSGCHGPQPTSTPFAFAG